MFYFLGLITDRYASLSNLVRLSRNLASHAIDSCDSSERSKKRERKRGGRKKEKERKRKREREREREREK